MKLAEQGASGVTSGSGRYIVSLILLAALYFATGKLGLLLAIPPGNATSVWPPSGIALAAVVLLGQRVWPGIWLGAMLVNATTHASLITSAGIGVGNTLEALLAAYLLHRFVGKQDLFQRGKDVFIFGGLVAGLSCTVAATIGVTSLWLGGSLPASGYASNWLTWWSGDVAGIVVVTPLILTWSKAPRITWNAALRAEWLIVAALLLTVSLTIFLHSPLPEFPRARALMVLLLLGWTAFRFGQRETAIAVAMVVGSAIGDTVLGSGLFYNENMLNHSLLRLQAFASIVAVTSLTLAAAVAERREMETTLRQARDDLDGRVRERTAELGRANDSLQAEVVERKQAEQALWREQDRLARLMESSPVGITVVNRDGQITFANTAAERVLGLAKGEIIQRSYNAPAWRITTYDGAPLPDVELPFCQVMIKGQPVYAARHAIEWPDGKRVLLSINARPVFDEAGLPDGMIATVEDVTRQVHAEKELRETRELLTSLLDHAPLSIYAASAEGRLQLVNRKWEAMVGLGREDAIGRPLDEVFSPETARQYQAVNQQVIDAAAPMVAEEFFDDSNGRHFFHTVKFPLHGMTGRVESVGGMSIDITERKRAEEELRESEARYRSLFENSLDGVLLTAPDGRILSANREACRIFGRTEEELRQMGRAGVVDVTDPRLAALLEERSRTGKCRGELTHLRGDGSTFEGEISSAVFTDRDGAPRTSMIIRDISERKRAEEDLQKSEAKAVQLGRENAIMAEIGRIIGSTLNIDEVYERFSEEVKKILRFDRIVINMIDTEEGAVRNVYIAGEELQDRNVQDIYPLQGSGNAEMVRTNSSLLIQTEDFNEYRDRFPMLVTTFEAGFRSILNVPLFSKGKLIGGLLLRSRQPFAYTEKDVRLSERIGSQIAGAVANARLFDAAQREIAERKRAEEALSERTRQLEAIHAVTIEISRELDLTTLLQLITRRASDLVGVASGTVWFWDEEAQVLVPKAWHGHSRWWDEVRLRSGEGVAGTVAQRREGLIVNDYRTSPYAYPFFLERTNFTAVMGEPLTYRDRLLGVVTIDDTGLGRHFTEKDRELLRLFASQAAIAIENARLFQSVSEQHAQLRNLTARLADVDETQRQQMSRELHDCVGGNLAALNLNLGIVQSQLPTVGAVNATARIAECMRLAEEAAQNIRSVMTELRPPLLDDQGLVAAIRWYTDQFSARTGVGVAVRGEESRPRLSRSAEIALFRIAQEVLTNVAKHAQAGEATLMFEETTEKVRLTIADDGVGFDPAMVRPHGKQPWWGLMTMRERAVAIGGSLRVESAPGSGTRVIVEVPR